jgi:hypothetical protein
MGGESVNTEPSAGTGEASDPCLCSLKAVAYLGAAANTVAEREVIRCLS